MPLIPLPADNTKRYKLSYTVKAQEHSLTARCSAAQTDAVAVGYFTAIKAAILASLSSDTTLLGVLVANQGSNVFNPVAGFTPASGGGGSLAAGDEPRSFAFPGRTSGGRKTRATWFGVDSSIPTGSDYEQDPLTVATLQGFQGLLNSQSDFWLGIDGVKASWYFRCTIKPNDHFVDKAR